MKNKVGRPKDIRPCDGQDSIIEVINAPPDTQNGWVAELSTISMAMTDRQNEENGVNTDIMNFMIEVKQISSMAVREDPVSLRNCFYAYLQLCAKRGKRVTNQMAYMSMGCAREVVDDWAHGKVRTSDPRYKELAIEVRQTCSAMREQLGMEGKANPVLTLWWQKCYDGYSETMALNDYTGDDNERENRNADEIRRKYADLTDD